MHASVRKHLQSSGDQYSNIENCNRLGILRQEAEARMARISIDTHACFFAFVEKLSDGYH
jgi:hypothetical protein